MRYIDKVLSELNRYIPDGLYMGPKFTSRMMNGRSIKVYDILITRKNVDNLPKASIFKMFNDKNFYIRLQGEKISVNVLEEDIMTHLVNKPITVQSISLNVNNGSIDTDMIIDPLNVIPEIKEGYVGFNKEYTPKKDPQALIKIVEYMALSKLKLNPKSRDDIKEHGYLIKTIESKRIKRILFNILECKKSYFYFNYMDEELDILNKIFPQIDTMKNIGKCKYHVVDTWTHSINTMKEIENIIYADGYFENHLKRAYELHSNTLIGNYDRVKLLKLGALFHDIGKPKAQWVDSTGRNRFGGHETIGAEIVEEICKALEFSDAETSYLKKIVVNHMVTLILYKSNDVSGSSLFNVFEKLGEDTMDIILVGLADIISTRRLLKPYEEMSIYKIHAEYLVNNYLIRYRKVLSLVEVISLQDIIDELDCNLEQAECYMVELRKAIFNELIYLDKEKIIEFLKAGE